MLDAVGGATTRRRGRGVLLRRDRRLGGRGVRFRAGHAYFDVELRDGRWVGRRPRGDGQRRLRRSPRDRRRRHCRRSSWPGPADYTGRRHGGGLRPGVCTSTVTWWPTISALRDGERGLVVVPHPDSTCRWPSRSRPPTQIAAESNAGRDAIVMIFGAIGVIVAGVAALAVMSTMTVNLFERRHELAALQAIGARRATDPRAPRPRAPPVGAVGVAAVGSVRSAPAASSARSRPATPSTSVSSTPSAADSVRRRRHARVSSCSPVVARSDRAGRSRHVARCGMSGAGRQPASTAQDARIAVSQLPPPIAARRPAAARVDHRRARGPDHVGRPVRVGLGPHPRSRRAWFRPLIEPEGWRALGVPVRQACSPAIGFFGAGGVRRAHVRAAVRRRRLPPDRAVVRAGPGVRRRRAGDGRHGCRCRDPARERAAEPAREDLAGAHRPRAVASRRLPRAQRRARPSCSGSGASCSRSRVQAVFGDGIFGGAGRRVLGVLPSGGRRAGAIPRIAVMVGGAEGEHRRLVPRTDRLAKAEERVSELSIQRQDILDAVAGERRRIERNLHDGVQQQLVAIGLDLGMAEQQLDRDPSRAELIVSARQKVQGSIGELRQLGRGLHPAILEDRGIDAALSAIVSWIVDPDLRPRRRRPRSRHRRRRDACTSSPTRRSPTC
jgi:hypothetical protein